MKHHVCTEAVLKRKPSATLGTMEGLLCTRSMDSQVGSELQQLGEGLPAVSAAQRMLLTAATAFIAFAPRTLELY